jgi:hypothetical protein
MANSNAPMGLKPVGSGDGPYIAQTMRYYVPSSDTTALFIGDPVILAGSADANGVPTITIATAGTTNRVTGAIVGFDPSPTIVANGYRLASTAEYVLVEVGPNTVYEIQEDALGAPTALVDIGENASLVAGAGSTYTKRSGWQLDSSTHATASLQLRMLAFVQRPDNEPAVANAKLLVRINQPTETGAAGSTGV